MKLLAALFGVFLIGLVLLLTTKHHEEKQWNNGACPECEKGFFKPFDMASDFSVGYQCTHCGNVTWQSYNRRLVK